MTQDKPKNKAREWAQALIQAAAEGKQIEVWDARDKPKNKAAQDLGSLGGKAGKGAAKRRSPQHYQKMVEARAEQRKARAEEECENCSNPTSSNAGLPRESIGCVSPEKSLASAG